MQYYLYCKEPYICMFVVIGEKFYFGTTPKVLIVFHLALCSKNTPNRSQEKTICAAINQSHGRHMQASTISTVLCSYPHMCMFSAGEDMKKKEPQYLLIGLQMSASIDV